jgi:hypothetical protein
MLGVLSRYLSSRYIKKNIMILIKFDAVFVKKKKVFNLRLIIHSEGNDMTHE